MISSVLSPQWGKPWKCSVAAQATTRVCSSRHLVRMVSDRVAALIERGVVPIKLEFLRPAAEAQVVVSPLPCEGQPPPTSQNKSKKQLKRVSRPAPLLHHYL